jgi:D-glycero-alpha-D-manno-heptose-7-phosphate kinase
VITAIAPSRICDNGGWTDTWFARHGRVLNIAVLPGAEVRVAVRPFTGGERVTWRAAPTSLLDATVQSVSIPDEVALDIDVTSDMPPGASTGTSAAVTVALLAALSALEDVAYGESDVASGFSRTREIRLKADSTAIARAAHRVETDLLHQQSGIQDQLASAFGGINFIEIDEYPDGRVTPVPLDDRVSAELEQRLALIYLGEAHRSSEVHEKVIARLAARGPDCRELDDLRRAADAARDALIAGDLEAFGGALTTNTDAQARLHPDLVSADARHVIEIARRSGASGWKINGAGGNGGSISILCGRSRDEMLQAIEAADARFRVIPIQVSAPGLRVEVT